VLRLLDKRTPDNLQFFTTTPSSTDSAGLENFSPVPPPPPIGRRDVDPSRSSWRELHLLSWFISACQSPGPPPYFFHQRLSHFPGFEKVDSSLFQFPLPSSLNRGPGNPPPPPGLYYAPQLHPSLPLFFQRVKEISIVDSTLGFQFFSDRDR